jgi:putative inorganic carbon (HCO3(-)) transporter
MTSPAPGLDRKALLPYAIGFDLVVIAVGIGLLLPQHSGLILAPFLAAVGVAAARSGWKVGLTTTAFSLAGLLVGFGRVPPAQLLIFTLAGAAASALLGRRRAVSETADREHALVYARFTELAARVRSVAVPALMNLGLPLLVAVVYCNLSHILVENFSMPSILQPLILITAGLVLLYRDTFRPSASLVQPLTFALIGYCIVVFTSSNWARDIAPSNLELTDITKSFLLLFVVASAAATWRALRLALAAMVAGAALLSLITIIQVAIGNPGLHFGGLGGVQVGHLYGDLSEMRPSGPVGDPNYYARILLLAFPAAAFLGVGRTRARDRFVWLAAAGAIAVAILFTYSRGGMMTLAFLGLLLVLVRRVRINWVTVGIGAIALAAILPTSVGQRLLTIETLLSADDVYDVDASVGKRQQLLAVGWRMFTEHPFAGVGVGNFGSHYPAYANLVGSNTPDYTPMGARQYAHNLYLEMATETGLLGVLAFAIAMTVGMVTLWNARTTLLARGQQERAALVTAIAFAIAGYLLSSIFLQHSGFQRYLWLVLGLGVAAVRLTEEESQPAQG